VVATGKDPAAFEFCDRLAADLEGAGVRVLYDDRSGVSPGVKFKDAELLGMPTIVVVGKNLADGEIEIRDRLSGERRTVAVDSALDEVLAETTSRV
jgi:prolyl-tRNA synthetase